MEWVAAAPHRVITAMKLIIMNVRTEVAAILEKKMTMRMTMRTMQTMRRMRMRRMRMRRMRMKRMRMKMKMRLATIGGSSCLMTRMTVILRRAKTRTRTRTRVTRGMATGQTMLGA